MFCEVNLIALKSRKVMESVFGMSGFCRTNVALSFRSQIEPKTFDVVSDYVNEKYKHRSGPFIYDFYKGFATYASNIPGTHASFDKAFFPSFFEFKNEIISLLSNKAAGVAGSKVEILLPFGLGNVVSRQATTKNGKTTILVKLKSKRDVFFTYGIDCLKRLSLERGLMTVMNPGRTSTRSVAGGKKERTVFQRSLVTMLFEAIFTLPLYIYISDKYTDNEDISSSEIMNPKASYGNSVFTIGSERGIIGIDHAQGLYSTDAGDRWNDLTDYDTYDASLNHESMRKPALDGMIDGLINTLHSTMWGDPEMKETQFPGGLPEIINILWGPGGTREAYFQIDGIEEPIPVDMLQSGEHGTIVYGGVANIANYRSFNQYMNTHSDETRKLIGSMSVERINVHGDDFVGIFKEINPIL